MKWDIYLLLSAVYAIIYNLYEKANYSDQRAWKDILTNISDAKQTMMTKLLDGHKEM